MADYWDTSCLLKLYCQESDSETFRNKIAAALEPPVASTLTRTELSYAFQQKAVRGETGGHHAETLFDFLQKDIRMGRIRLFPIGSDVLERAERIASQCYDAPEPIFLRTLDGIHLATAQMTKSRRIISTDDRMNKAAQLLGMDCFAP